VKTLIAAKRFREARKQLALLGLGVTRKPKRVRTTFAKLQTSFETSRTTWLQKEVLARFVETARILIHERAQAPRATATAALTWIRLHLAAEASKRIAKALAPLDQVLAPEILATWRARRGGDWKIFVYPRYGQSRDVDVRERWWVTANLEHRETRLFQALLLDTDLLQLGTHDPKVPCTRCKGEGFLTKRDPRGRQTAVPCPRCGGSHYEKATRWR